MAFISYKSCRVIIYLLLCFICKMTVAPSMGFINEQYNKVEIIFGFKKINNATYWAKCFYANGWALFSKWEPFAESYVVLMSQNDKMFTQKIPMDFFQFTFFPLFLLNEIYIKFSHIDHCFIWVLFSRLTIWLLCSPFKVRHIMGA